METLIPVLLENGIVVAVMGALFYFVINPTLSNFRDMNNRLMDSLEKLVPSIDKIADSVSLNNITIHQKLDEIKNIVVKLDEQIKK